jgi:gram-positive specific serine protease
LSFPSCFLFSKVVRIGEHTISKTNDCNDKNSSECYSKDISIDEIIIHELYTEKEHDIALVRLNEDVEFQKNVKTICLPVSDIQKNIKSNNAIARKLNIAGWGKTANDESSDVLQKTVVDYLDHEDCVERFETASKTHKGIKINVQRSQICAVGRDNSDA